MNITSQQFWRAFVCLKVCQFWGPVCFIASTGRPAGRALCTAVSIAPSLRRVRLILEPTGTGRQSNKCKRSSVASGVVTGSRTHIRSREIFLSFIRTLFVLF